MKLSKIKTIFIIIAVIYVLSPLDFLPDLLGLIGRIDDLALVIFLFWKYKQIKNNAFSRQNTYNTESVNNSKKQEAFCPYKTLEIEKTASKQEIIKAYKIKIKEYHPDKVEHLGDELKEVAKKKILDVQKAYEILNI